MAPKKGASSRKFAEDAPWRAASGEKTVPKISQGVHPDPIGHGLASEDFVEPAGPDCIISGLTRPVRVLGVQVWPINLPVNASMKALEPIGREMKSFIKLLDKAFDHLSVIDNRA